MLDNDTPDIAARLRQHWRRLKKDNSGLKKVYSDISNTQKTITKALFYRFVPYQKNYTAYYVV